MGFSLKIRNISNNFSCQTCEDVIPTAKCFQPSCTNVSRPIFTKDCREVLEEKCEVIIEQIVEQKCIEVEQTEYEEQCSTGYEQQCETVDQYQCQDAPDTEYGVTALATEYGAAQVCKDMGQITKLPSYK